MRREEGEARGQIKPNQVMILKPGIRFDHPTDQGGKLETRDAPDL